MKQEFDLKNIFLTIDDDLIFSRYKKDSIVELEDAQELAETVYNNVVEDKIYGQIVDVRQMKSMSREARDYFASLKKGYVEYSALLISGLFQRNLAKMYFMFSKPKIETKVFEKEDDAIVWVREKLKNHKKNS